MLSRHGRRPHLVVTGAFSTLAGIDELPGHLDGHGTITAPLLRAIAKSWGTLTTIGVDPATGTATAIGALTYRPGQQLADQVIALSGTCRMAGCRQPAWRCDIDHVNPFDQGKPCCGGRTELGNAIPECKFHHLVKHHTAWTPQLMPDLSIRWTTATGHHATSHAKEFTLPGEWSRPEGRNDDVISAAEAEHALACGHCAGGAGDRDRDGDDIPPAGVSVIVGPTVTGPTIPLVDLDPDFVEPYTELEDPDTVPDPGSVRIYPYRHQRLALRERALRRINKISRLSDPTPAPTVALVTRPPARSAARIHALNRPATAAGKCDPAPACSSSPVAAESDDPPF